MKRLLLITALLATQLAAPARQSIPVHDPVMIRHDSLYYLFCTGRGISVWSSPDWEQWKQEAPVFSQPPAWAVAAVPGFRGHTWAPDISYHNGLYYLFYSVSAFGKNTSCIGLATNPTLDPASPQFKWTDHGKVIQSVPGRDLWNAIDPALAFDEQQTPWLAFGSFWSGIKLVKLAPGLRAPASPETWYTIAARPRAFGTPDTSGGNAAIEAPFIYKKGKYYYLFVSFDYCCRGKNSNYKVVAGRSEKITGPYLDREGTPLLQGGGTLVAQGNSSWYGVGHNAICRRNGKDYLVFHGYDAADNGRSRLLIRELHWDAAGWPSIRL